MVQHVSLEQVNRMSSTGRRKSENTSDLGEKTRINDIDKKNYSNDILKPQNDLPKLDIGEHYMVKRGDTWRKYILGLFCSLVVKYCEG